MRVAVVQAIDDEGYPQAAGFQEDHPQVREPVQDAAGHEGDESHQERHGERRDPGGIELAVKVVERRARPAHVHAQGQVGFRHGLVERQEHGVVEHVVAGGPQHHHGRGPQALGLVDRLHGPRDVFQVDHPGPLETVAARQRVAHPAVVGRAQRRHEREIGGERVGQEERRIDHLDVDVLGVQRLQPGVQVGQFLAVQAVQVLPLDQRAMPGGLAVDPGRSAEVVAAQARPPRNDLLVDHPVEQAPGADDGGPPGAERRVQVLVVEGRRALVHMSVCIDNSHSRTHCRFQLSSQDRGGDAGGGLKRLEPENEYLFTGTKVRPDTAEEYT